VVNVVDDGTGLAGSSLWSSACTHGGGTSVYMLYCLRFSRVLRTFRGVSCFLHAE
jgi:hypothetical protein